MRKRHHDTKPGAKGKARTVPVELNDDDARELQRHAKRLGVPVDVLLTEAMAVFSRDIGGEQPLASTVEYLANHGRKILRKCDLN